MVKLRKYEIRWDPAPEDDVTHYRVYWALEGEALNYDSPHQDVGPTPGDDGKIYCNLTEIPGFPTEEANIQIGVTSVDDVGNEPDMRSILIPFDLKAPSPITGLELVE